MRFTAGLTIQIIQVGETPPAIPAAAPLPQTLPRTRRAPTHGARDGLSFAAEEASHPSRRKEIQVESRLRDDRTIPDESARGAGAATLADQIYDEILHLILNKPLPEGSRLPTEAQFCQMYSVSRTVVREALSRLKIDGIVTSRQGQGSMVLRKPNAGVLDYPDIGSIATMQRLFEFRQVIECEVAGFAATRHTPEQLARIEAAHRAVDVALAAGAHGIEEDRLLHLAIAEAAHNAFLLAALASAGPQFVKSIEFARSLSGRLSPGRIALVSQEHAAIVEAIRARDAEAARAAMAEHLTRTRTRVFLEE
nr:FCD domain-containing protein [Paracoccus litorisediminis]